MSSVTEISTSSLGKQGEMFLGARLTYFRDSLRPLVW